MVDVHSPYPLHAQVSRRNYCRVDVGPDPKDWVKADQRKMLLEIYLEAHEPSWGNQFKHALMMGPTINEEDAVEDVSF